MSESIGLIVGLVLTLLIYSYLLGDNPLYRIAIHLLVGVTAAYSAIVVFRQVMLPIYEQVQQDPTNPDNFIWLVPIFLGLLLLLKRLPTISWLGNISLALLIGVGAAISLTGALIGTLWPQVTAVSNTPQLFPGQGIVVAVLTASTLAAFQFSGRTDHDGQWTQPGWQRAIGTMGQLVVTMTFGVLFATVINSSLILLSDRLRYVLRFFGI